MSTPHKPSPSCPSALSSADLQLHYLTEGAANIIYSVSVLSPAKLQDHSHCCILRLRKDLPSTKPAVEVLRDFESRIYPLFAGHGYGDFLMKQALYQLTPEMVHDANVELSEMETETETETETQLEADNSSDDHDNVTSAAEHRAKATVRVRHPHRRHVYLPSYETEKYGILMQNLKGPGIDQLVEFKPKWLVQSPSAPSDARNCRTCALNAMRRAAGHHQGRGDSGFCPLDLLAGPDEEEVLGRALTKIYQPSVERGMQAFISSFRQRVQPALRHLLTLQEKHGSVGLDDFRDPAGKDLDLAMALRDCSVFLALKVSSKESAPERVELVDVKFADLDLKTPEGGKMQKWASMEQELLDGGWYHNNSEGMNCSLSRPS
ncbi:hypothetical protein A1O1_03901 [Capronia coronata CBS 617.96]|uniref:Inositol-pentakisphosphate 2-kinase n=1 Tax=Capronia coronata CBS 617.96 TaxID=1182541 RepID=W9YD38_9EURO|nr:uncharacterized protein A1O1_03901 [Capronia coronata CBS 617.96]EXJ90797.1 hypothetical protein A1O1_03901 [Capronia coronata CBS 617.96]